MNPMIPDKAHYTIHLEVTHTQVRQQQGSASQSRNVTQLANVTIRADDLAKLIAKAGAHLELIEDV